MANMNVRQVRQIKQLFIYLIIFFDSIVLYGFLTGVVAFGDWLWL